MDKIYLIYANDDGYDCNPYVVTFTETEDDAKLKVGELTTIHNKALALNNKIFDALDSYTVSNPIQEYEEHISLPRWGGGLASKNITNSMREERNAIIERNREIGDRNSTLLMKYNKSKMASIKHILDLEDADFLKANFSIGEAWINFNSSGLNETNPFYYEELTK
jgi:hypothetical protein